MKVDKAGLDFLREVEGLKLVAYRDSGGVPTLGIGSTRMFGKPVKLGMTCTEAEAYEQCAEDLGGVEFCINSSVRVPLTQDQFNSLASFVYNVGEHAFMKSTLLRLLNMGNYDAAAKQFRRWRFDNGKEVQGLLNRRIKECKLFQK